MSFANRKNLIIFIAVMVIVTVFSISNYIDKQKVYVLSADEQNSIEDDMLQDANDAVYENTNDNIEKIIVHIEGEVVSPGVYELNKNSRVFDTIEAAGGLLENADRKKINLAKKITDEEYIYIPNVEEEIELENINNSSHVISSNVNTNNNTNENLININTANNMELQKLPGIGEVISNRIIEYRDQNGKFISIESLKNVNGIGDKKFNDIKDKVVAQ